MLIHNILAANIIDAMNNVDLIYKAMIQNSFEVNFNYILNSISLYNVLINFGIFITTIIVIIITKYFILYLFPRKYTIKENFPFENTIKMLQNQSRLLDFMVEYFKITYETTKRKTFIVKVFGLAPFVMTNNIDNITYILKTNYENFTKSGPIFKSKFQGLLGNGIFNSDGKQWYAHRKTSSHLFKLNEFKTTVLDIFNHDLTIVMNLIQTYEDKPFDIQSLMHKFTLESISQIAFGIKLGCITNDHVIFANDFDFCTASINDSMVNPLWLYERLFTIQGWKYFYYLFRLNRFAYKIITERRAMINSNKDFKRNDLLSLYLNKENFNDYSTDDNDKEKDGYLEPNDENLRDVILNMIIAGRDTTAQALSWTFYRLCIHPDIQKKVRDEVKYMSISHKEASSSSSSTATSIFMSYQMLQQLKYTEAVCLEALRLHPSVPKEGKCVGKADVLPDGTPVYPGDLVSFHPWCMGRDVSLWGEDALEFKPERFLTQTKPNPFIFTAFQAGPRTCLGQNFAILEMKCTLARLLSKYEFKLEQSPDSVTYSNSLTLPIQDGLMVSAREI